MGWTTRYDEVNPFVANEHSLIRAPGRQIAWESVTEAYRQGTEYTITVNDADAMEGDETLTVDAIGVDMPVGTVLDFGELAADAYTITLNDAAAAEGDTEITVTAIGVDMPVGTVLDFGEHSVDSVQMLAKLSADAASGATTLTVEPLGHAIEDASTANYPGAAQQQVAKLAAAASSGDTSLTVEPLAGPIVDDATATYIDTSATDGVKTIPAGTAMAALSSGKIVPRVARPGSETAIGILEASATEEDVGGASGYGVIRGGVIYKNLLPDYSAGEPWDTIESELEAAGVGIGWVWETYTDDTAS